MQHTHTLMLMLVFELLVCELRSYLIEVNVSARRHCRDGCRKSNESEENDREES